MVGAPKVNENPVESAEASALRVGFRRERNAIAGFALAFAVGIVGIVGAMVWTDRQKALQTAESELRNLGLAHSEITARTLEGVDFLLRAAIQTAGEGDLSDGVFTARLHAYLRERVIGSQVFRAISVFDADGRMRAQSRSHPPPPVDIGDREHFVTVRGGAPGTLAVGTPAFNRTTGEWSLFFARRLAGPDGSFGGAAVVTVDPGYFERIYAAINRGRGDGAIEMFRDDGTLLARHLSTPEAQAYSAGDSTLRENLARSTEIKVARGRLGIDGENRIVAARFIEAFPVYVAISEREDTALADWRRSATVFASVAAAMLLVLGALTFMLRAQVSRRETLHRSSERAARVQTALLRAIIDNMPIGVSVVDPDLKVFAFNATFIDLLELRGMGLKPGDTLESVFRFNAERGEYGSGDIDEHVRSRLDLARHPVPHHFERRRPRGQTIDIRGRPLADGTMVTTYVDVTARARTEAELRGAKETAEVANRAKSAFLASMSHELRTPLNAVIGFSEIISNQSFGEIQPRYVEYSNDVLAAARHLLAVINDILDMSKIEAGRYELAVRPLALASVAARALDIAKGLASEKGVKIATEIEPGLPEIVGDERAIKQVLLNLLSNAVKFNRREGVVTLRLAALEGGDQQITVVDTGLGISEEALKSLFQPFRQDDTMLTRPGEGAGLGLWISQQFVRLHGGALRLESKLGHGTTAIVRLPPAPPDPAI